MDVILPRLSGVEAVQAIRKQDSGTPILMLTALGTTDDKLAGFDAGVNDYLVKPFDFRDLLPRALTDLLDNAAEYSDDQPVTVRLADGSPGLVLSIRDHGIGIDPED